MVVGHICPEAYVGGNIAFIKDGDRIVIDAHKKIINVELSEKEIDARKVCHPPQKNIRLGFCQICLFSKACKPLIPCLTIKFLKYGVFFNN